jgi:hypothetical protein
MTRNEDHQTIQHNVINGDGNIAAGTFTHSQVINQSGDHNHAANNIVRGNDKLGPLVKDLETQLAEVRSRLDGIQDPRFSTDRDDALDAVTALQTDLPRMGDEPGTSKRLRQRVKELLGALAPVAEIIGGVAALQGILQHL